MAQNDKIANEEHENGLSGLTKKSEDSVKLAAETASENNDEHARNGKIDFSLFHG